MNFANPGAADFAHDLDKCERVANCERQTRDKERLYHGYLTVPQVDVLTALADAEGASLSCSEIAERTLLTKDGITGILDRLEAKGLVKRIRSRDDRRGVLVRLSAKGGELFRKLFPEMVRCNRSLFKKALKPEQLKELGGLPEILIRSLEWE